MLHGGRAVTRNACPAQGVGSWPVVTASPYGSRCHALFNRRTRQRPSASSISIERGRMLHESAMGVEADVEYATQDELQRG